MFKLKYLFSRFLLKVSYFFIELSDFLHNLPVAFLKPADLTRLCQVYYSRDEVVEGWRKNAELGLTAREEDFVLRYGLGSGNALVAGCACGREAVALAKKGFCVTGIDFSLSMINAAKERCDKQNVEAIFERRSIVDFDAPEKTFSMIFLGANYGCIPTCRLRINTLLKLKKMLKEGGGLFISFVKYAPSKFNKLNYFLYRILGILSFGNRWVEKGDVLLGDGEFHHCFSSLEEVVSEIKEAGFAVEQIFEEENVLFLSPAYESPA